MNKTERIGPYTEYPLLLSPHVLTSKAHANPSPSSESTQSVSHAVHPYEACVLL